jgi:hypothetical protein
VDARDNAVVSAPVHRLDGMHVASGFADLWDETINASISIDQFLANTGTMASWTGTDGSGQNAGANYLGSVFPVFGTSTSTTTGHWVFTGAQDPDDARSLYGLSEQLTVTAIPEASCITACLLLSAISTAIYAWRRCHVKFDEET